MVNHLDPATPDALWFVLHNRLWMIPVSRPNKIDIAVQRLRLVRLSLHQQSQGGGSALEMGTSLVMFLQGL